MLCFDHQAFAAFDREGVGLITKEDLHQIINAFCFVMSEKQFQVDQLALVYSCNTCTTDCNTTNIFCEDKLQNSTFLMHIQLGILANQRTQFTFRLNLRQTVKRLTKQASLILLQHVFNLPLDLICLCFNPAFLLKNFHVKGSKPGSSNIHLIC